MSEEYITPQDDYGEDERRRKTVIIAVSTVMVLCCCFMTVAISAWVWWGDPLAETLGL